MSKEELNIQIGDNLRHARLAQGLTQECVAEQTGISTSFYANLECGKKSMSLSVLVRLSEVLRVSTDSILFSNDAKIASQTIQVLLQGKSASYVQHVERLVRICMEEFPDTLPIETLSH